MAPPFIGRGFSGDKAHLVPMVEAALQLDGFALVDVVSPCVAFSDHQCSTKCYRHTREIGPPAVLADLIPPQPKSPRRWSLANHGGSLCMMEA